MFNYQEFANPQTQYRSAPFWSLNGKLEEAELRRQIQEMHAQGMGGFFMHPRGGMKDEYMGESFIEAIGACIDEGKKLGMHAWLYDEDRFPSGGAGGLLTQANKDYAAKTLEMKIVTTLEGISYDRIFCREGDDFIDITSQPSKGASEYIVFSTTTIEPSPLWNNEYYGDMLSGEAVEYFIKLTHEKYKASFGDDFGGAIPGIFTDEPLIYVRRDDKTRVAWTNGFDEIFKASKAYSLLDNAYKLFYPVGDYLKVRYDYWDVISRLFVQNFTAKVGQWCEENDLKFTGHFWEHDFPRPLHTGSTMPNYVHMQYPGIDLLFNTDDYIGQYGNVFIVKELSSIKNQFGKERALSETYGASGWELSFIDQKRIADWQFVLGVDFVCQHLTHLSLEGYRKRDFPLSFCDRQPWWSEYKLLGDYIGRLSYVISQGQEIADILVLHPSHSTFMSFENIGDNIELEKIDQSVKWLTKALCETQLYYDLGDEYVMEDIAEVRDGYVNVGKMRYKTIILPYITNIKASTFELLKKFANSGGKILSLASGPVMLEGEYSQELTSFLQGDCVTKIGPEKAQLSALLRDLDNLGCEIVETMGKDISDLYVCERDINGQTAMFIVNTSKTESYDIQVALKDLCIVEQLDCITGEIHPMPTFHNDKGAYLKLALSPVESCLLLIKGQSPEKVRVDKPECTKVITLPLDGFVARRAMPNALTIQSVKYRLDSGNWSDEMNVVATFDRIREAMGFEPGHIFGRQPWMLTQEDCTPAAKLEAEYTFTADFVPGAIEIAAEVAGECKLYVNGSLVPSSGKHYISWEFVRHDIGQYVIPGKNTVLLQNSNFGIKSVLESIYVIGDFAVNSDFSLTKESPIKAGDWTKSGYPFYSGEMSYRSSFQLDACVKKAELLLGKLSGVAVVYVNGKRVKTLAFPPFSTDITEFLQAGDNEIEIRVKNTLQNLLGPHSSEGKGLVTPGSFYLKEAPYYFDPSGLCDDCRIKLYK